MWDKIREHLENGDHESARSLLDQEKSAGEPCDDTFAILEASVCEAEQDREGMFDAIAGGLSCNPENFELYYMLGRFYASVNPDQAFLCFQNALFYCDSGQDCETIQTEMDHLGRFRKITVRNTAIVIVSYNACQLLQKNIESIRSTLLKGTYQIIVVDNASGDGAADWLERQGDVILIRNKENKGFAYACNQGAYAAREAGLKESDIFLLNNDTRLSPNALFWLRMGLYESERIGTVGSRSNYAGNEQQLDITFSRPEEYLEYGARMNVPSGCPCEERVRLSGFAMLVRGRVWDVVGGMDERFSPGYFEDDDLCMRILECGYRILLCRNSFVYHAGSQSFSREEGVEELLLSHQRLFVEKYGFDILEYASPDRNLLAGIPYSEKDEFNVLQVGCGLGADMKLLRTFYPNAHVAGLEQDRALAAVAAGTEAVFTSVKKLREVFRLPVFDVLLVPSGAYAQLSESDKRLVAGLCKRDCVVLSGKNPYEKFPFDRIKLVIWDLDDTFWKGTLSEGEIAFSGKNMQLVRDLADRGIISSISSRNEEAQAREVLKGQGLESLFVFNNINWENKGDQIRQKLIRMGLRAQNVLFIDDNVRNLEEAKYTNEGIMTAPPDIIPWLAGYIAALPLSDREHKRLGQYRVLERKEQAQERFDSREAFLYDSHISVVIGKECQNELDRIEELVTRTNQLNFTKVRSSRQELLRMVSNDWMDSGYVRVMDRYGDYGIVGFYCYNRQEERMEHFLFSCRILGMKVEQYVYTKLGSPELDIVEPVAASLEKDRAVPWITEGEAVEYFSQPPRDNRVKILLKGPCDLSVIESYLIGGKITTEFNYVNSAGFITAGQNHSMHIWESANCSQAELGSMLKEVPFLTRGDFETMLFEREYHIICYSLLPDAHAGLYRNRETGLCISFGSVNFDLTDERNWQGYMDGSIVNHAFPFTEKILRTFSEKWEFVGTTPVEIIARNLEYMYFNAPGSPVFVLLLGSEIEYEGENPEFADHARRHKEINERVKAFAADKKRVSLVNMTDFIHCQEDYGDSINHFSRNVYYNLATAVCSCINEAFGRK